ncbi:hypothetical protein GGR42_001277 [Saonia flava]|uniref:Outer membrane protein beta-barrel domain-containing protein n=1 Tax=Saonia flava TaxID=523696 RepID=A0A846QYV2_9FLAO|nr:hypothetical protein [Saonia flava]NJB70815.1 hypothetical protein [Saonia flava]
MRTLNIFVLVVLLFSLFIQKISAQDSSYKEKVEVLEERKNKITFQEKEALKIEVEDINRRIDNNEITQEEAKTLKEAAATKRALNIEDRIAIIENEISLLERNDGKTLILIEADTISGDNVRFGISFNGKPAFSFSSKNSKHWKKREIKYDRRTYSDFVMAIGLNNTLIEGQSIEDTPYKIGGSRFFEMGWQWRTRVFKNSNFMRINYGFSFQYNGLKPKDNQYFTVVDGQSELADFEYELKKSKLRMDNLVFPMHLEFGPSRKRENENNFRYSIQNQFRIGIGGYGGFNLGTRQKLKYDRAGENVKDKLKRGYNTTNFVYGLSGYVGFDGVLLYAKYDLNPLFKNADIEQRNISLGLRFDL